MSDDEETLEQRALRVIRVAVDRSLGAERAGSVTLSTVAIDLGLDSLERVELAIDLEWEFVDHPGFEVPDDLHYPTGLGNPAAAPTVGELILGLVEQLRRLERS